MTRIQQQLRKMTDAELRAEYANTRRPGNLWNVISRRLAEECCIEASRRGIHIS